jgi:hypothetical protein
MNVRLAFIALAAVVVAATMAGSVPGAGPGAPGPTPREVTLYALHHQRIYVLLGARERLARAVVFGLIGIFVVRAAWQYDPDEAVGLDGR